MQRLSEDNLTGETAEVRETAVLLLPSSSSSSSSSSFALSAAVPRHLTLPHCHCQFKHKYNKQRISSILTFIVRKGQSLYKHSFIATAVVTFLAAVERSSCSHHGRRFALFTSGQRAIHLYFVGCVGVVQSAEIEETLKRIQGHAGVEGYVIVNDKGEVLRRMQTLSTADATTFGTEVYTLAQKARHVVRDLDPTVSVQYSYS